MRTVVGISLGAVAGALCRYYVGLWSIQILGNAFPIGTMLINITGCFLMGFLVTIFLIRDVEVHPDTRLMVTTGFLGSYTTFSSYELDTAELLTRNFAQDLLYWVGTPLLGVIGLQLGTALAEKFRIQENDDQSE